MKRNITFAQYREQQIRNYKIPALDDINEWQDERAIKQRIAFVEHAIRLKWQSFKE